MPITWVDGGTPALSAANLNSMVADDTTALWSAAALSTKTASYTATSTDKVLIYNGSSITATLPDPTTVANRIYIIKNIHTTNLTVVSAGTSKTIDGVASVLLFQNVTATFVSNGTAWFALSGLELLATAAAAVRAYANTSSSEPAFTADSSGVSNRTALRAAAGSGTGNQLETGQLLSGIFYKMFAINNNGRIDKLNNIDFTFTTVSSNPQDAISGGVYGVVIDTGAGLTFQKKGNNTSYWPAWNFHPYGFTANPRTETANYTVDCRDTVIVGNGASITITLPDPTSTGVSGRMFKVKNIHSTSLTIVSAGTSKTIDGAASQTLAQWAYMTVMTNGTTWYIV